MKADIVVFNPQTVRDRSTYEDPHHFSEGVSHVLVDGTAVLRDGRMTWGPKYGLKNAVHIASAAVCRKTAVLPFGPDSTQDGREKSESDSPIKGRCRTMPETESRIAPSTSVARLFVKHILGFGVGVASGLSVYLGKVNVPLFAPLLQMIPDKLHSVLIPLSSALMGTAAVMTEFYSQQFTTACGE